MRGRTSRSLTTAIYAKVDRDTLRMIAFRRHGRNVVLGAARSVPSLTSQGIRITLEPTKIVVTL